MPQIGGTDLERLHSCSAEDLKGEIEARDSELAELRDAADRRREELRTESTRQSAHFEESLNRLQRELHEQSTESAERIRELKAKIEHLKITRFEAKSENYRIKKSLSWRMTWPLRLLRDAGMAFAHKSRARFRLFSSHPSAGVKGEAPSTAGVQPETAKRLASEEQQRVGIDRQSIELFTEGLSRLNRKKETVLLVTHESSRTGAPIIALNMTRLLRQKYNIVVVILRDGALGYEFLAGSDLVIGPLRRTRGRRTSSRLFSRRSPHGCRSSSPSSIPSCSDVTLSPLWENDIATLHLIHEFSLLHPAARTIPVLRVLCRRANIFVGNRSRECQAGIAETGQGWSGFCRRGCVCLR